MVQIIKRNYTAYSAWNNSDRNYTEYSVVVNGRKSYFHRIDNDSKTYEILSRHEMAVRLSYFRKTGYKYVDCNIPSPWQPGCTITERFDFIRRNAYTPCKNCGVALYWSHELNAWCFSGNLKEYSYSWHFIIYDKSVVDDILRELKTLPKEWEDILINV